MPPPSRRKRASRGNKKQPPQQKHRHVSDELGTVWLPDQPAKNSPSDGGSSADDNVRKLRVLQDQLDRAQTKEAKENKIRELVVAIFGFEPRPKQLEALVWVIAERKDLILIAKMFQKRHLEKVLFPRQSLCYFAAKSLFASSPSMLLARSKWRK